MAKTLQFKRYPTANLAVIAGAQGELIVDTAQNSLTVHDGGTLGGWPLATQYQLTSNSIYLNAVNNYQNTFIFSAVLNSGPQLISGNVYISNTISSTSNTTGALVVSGGVGIAGNVYIGGT